MEPVLFILMLAMIAASAIVFAANELAGQGQAWAQDVCAFYAACDRMHWLFVATAIVIVLYFIAGRMET